MLNSWISTCLFSQVFVGYLVHVVGAGVHSLPQDVPLLPSEEPPERREPIDLQTVQPDRQTGDE